MKPFSNHPLKKKQQLKDWYKGPLGTKLVEAIFKQLQPFLETSFGYYAVCLGCPDGVRHCFEAARIRHRFMMDLLPGDVDVFGEAEALPFAADSTDLVVLMHTLSLSSNPHAVLREVDRILIPEGKLVIVEFNPISLWGLRKVLTLWQRKSPWSGHYYAASRLRDWLHLLGFEQEHQYHCGYLLPLDSDWLMRHSSLFSRLCERWLGFSSALNVLVFEKNIQPLTPIRQRWARGRLIAPEVIRSAANRGMKYDPKKR